MTVIDSVAAQLSLPIPGEWIVQGGAVALLGMVALMVFIGRLVPRRTYDDLVQDRDYWREVALRAMGHAEALMPAAEITTRITEALGDAAAVEQALTPGRHESRSS